MAIGVSDLTVKIFADGADRADILAQYRNPIVSGFTTNPTLMHKAGITDYEAFARGILEAVPDRPFSFEVFSDDFEEMYSQACKISAWGERVFVKIPVTNTSGESAVPLLRRLAEAGVKVNVTALFTVRQVEAVSAALADAVPCYISVFAGRIADSGVDPLPVMRASVEVLSAHARQELIWASPREVLNVVQADQIGCHIITVTRDLIAKLSSLGRDLEAFSLDTVRMFRNDAVSAGFSI
jgi:transaldolase